MCVFQIRYRSSSIEGDDCLTIFDAESPEEAEQMAIDELSCEGINDVSVISVSLIDEKTNKGVE